jgi:hypothetical protein
MFPAIEISFSDVTDVAHIDKHFLASFAMLGKLSLLVPTHQQSGSESESTLGISKYASIGDLGSVSASSSSVLKKSQSDLGVTSGVCSCYIYK